MKWPKKRLDVVAEILMGQAPPGESYNLEGNGWPLLAGAGDFKGSHPVAKKFTTEAAKISMPGDIVIGVRASIGDKVVADREYCLGRGVAALRASAELHDRYLWHWLSSIKSSLEAKGKGATFKQVTKEDIAELEIPLPPLEEQRHIAAILDKAEKINSLLKVQNAVAESFMQSAFIELFGNPKEEPHNSLFSVTTLGKCCTLFSGGTLPDGEENTGQEGGFLLLKVSDMNLPGNEERIKTSKLWTTSPGAKSATCPAGSVVIPKRGGAIGTNKKRVVDRDAVLDPNLMAIAPGDQTITTEFIRGWFSFLDLSSITSGSSVPQLNKQDLSPLRLAIPPLQAQERYRELATCVLSMSDRYQKQSARSHALLAALHRKYFSGDNHE